MLKQKGMFNFVIVWAAAALGVVFCEDGTKYQSIDQVILAAGGGPRAFMGSFRSAPGGRMLAEFDMILSPQQYRDMYLSDQGRTKRKATSSLYTRWPDAKVYYFIKQGDFNVYERSDIRQAMDEFEKLSCLTFTEVSPNDPRNRIRIQNGVGCNSHLGMTGGIQPLNLGKGCRYVGTVIHELGHAIGWVHEHQLPDRDNYIEILYQNVNPAWRVWFNKLPLREVTNYGIHYDYKGIMHYGTTAFSDKGLQTIKAKDPSKEHLIQNTWHKHTLAWSDTKVANAMYKCNDHCPAAVKSKCPKNTSFLNKDCKCQYEDGQIKDPLSGETNPPTVKPGCENSHPSCQKWADRGECENNPNYMLPNCQVSCGTCPGQVQTTPNPLCMNENSRCPYWAKIGECLKNPGYMLVRCKKACSVC